MIVRIDVTCEVCGQHEGLRDWINGIPEKKINTWRGGLIRRGWRIGERRLEVKRRDGEDVGTEVRIADLCPECNGGGGSHRRDAEGAEKARGR